MYSNKAELDKFYTKEKVAVSCIDRIDLSKYDLIIEPSAGSGSFYNNIDSEDKLGIDLYPENDEIIQGDWFEFKIEPFFKNVLIIGNPPFGKRNVLSKKFLEHAASFSNVKTIAFVLPNVYNKHTLQKSVPKEFRLKEIFELPKNSFEIDGEDYHVPCSFFIFDKSKGDCLRFNPELYTETDDWTYANRREYDFFVMGAALNTVKDIPEENNRGYYIKVKKNKDIQKIKDNFINGNWKGFSSANGGVSWLTKPEVVKEYISQYN